MNVIKLERAPSVIGYAAVVGKKEHDGPLGDDFDLHDEDNTFGMDTWEKSESEMQRLALNTALAKGKAFSRCDQGDFRGGFAQSVHRLRIWTSQL